MVNSLWLVIGRYGCVFAIAGLDLALVSSVLRNSDGADMDEYMYEGERGLGRCSYGDYSESLLSDVQMMLDGGILPRQ
jgi:hypothetical protein